MSAFRYTLVADGPSDQCLLRLINFVLDDIPEVAERGYIPQFADPRLPREKAGGLAQKLEWAARLYPCDILFVHRDAEREPAQARTEEITTAAQQSQIPLWVPVVPVRMTEAWLLIDTFAIRRAADNPNGQVELVLPRVSDLEAVPDPKHVLSDLLTRASETTGRRLAQFRTPTNLSARRTRVADLIEDFTPLRRLSAFRAFEEATRAAAAKWHSRA